MNGKTMKSRLLASSVFAGVAFSLAGMTAMAQDDLEVIEEAADDVAVQEKVVITGSLIPQSGNLVETSPVTTIGSEEFDIRGTVRAEDMINTLPQAFGAQGSALANGSTGTASINLRGLGAERTLTLMNGRRLPYGSINTSAPDVNTIPSQLVKRVDVLTGGASATYGSDAISGVVNFVLDDEFEGLQFDANYSFFQHKNDNSIQGLISEFAEGNPSQYRLPDGNVVDGEAIDLNAIMGGQFDNGRGHMTAYAGFQNTNEVLQADRDYSVCALGTRSGGSEFTCSGSSTNQFANILNVGGAYEIPGSATIDSRTQTPWARTVDGQYAERNFVTDTFNFNPYNHFQRPQERYNFGMFADYDLDENTSLYTEMMFVNSETNSQIAPSGVFGYGIGGGAGGINCNNPFLSAQQVDYLCGEIADGVIDRYTILNDDGLQYTDAAGNILPDQDDPTTYVPRFDGNPDQAALGPDGVAPLILLRRNVEGGNRNQDIRHQTFRGVIGLQGDFENTSLGYDVYASFAKVVRNEVYNNDLSIRKLSQALNVLDVGGTPTCAINADTDTANDDPNCAPYDIFSADGPSAAALAYIVNPLNRSGNTTQTVVSGKVFGSLGDWGISLPSAEDAPAFAVGVEYRRDALDSNPDANYQSGDGAGQGGPTTPITGSQEVYDIFAELNVPLIQGAAGADHLGFDLAYRKSFYDEVDSDSYKVGLDWAPTSDIRLRGSYQRAVRAANIFELFDAQSIGLFDLDDGDPCASTPDRGPTLTAAQCANTGLDPALYGSAGLFNPAGQYNTFGGGNENLEPEESDTYTAGFVFTPSFVDGLTLSVDYFDITVDGYINTVPETTSLQQCGVSGDPFFCSLVNRGTNGTLWANNTGFVTATNVNTGSLETKGFDILGNYTWDMDARGSLSFNYVGTILDELSFQALPDASVTPSIDCAGTYGGACQNNFGTGANPDYRHKTGVTWASTNGDLAVTGTWRHFAEVDLQGNSNPDSINASLDAQNYLDLSARYNIWENTAIRAGVNNVMDEDPPLSSVVGTAPGNGNTYPQVYDALGRYIFVGATVDF